MLQPYSVVVRSSTGITETKIEAVDAPDALRQFVAGMPVCLAARQLTLYVMPAEQEAP